MERRIKLRLLPPDEQRVNDLAVLLDKKLPSGWRLKMTWYDGRPSLVIQAASPDAKAEFVQ